MIVMVSGHLNVTEEEFALHYEQRLRAHFAAGDTFVVGDARGADALAQRFLRSLGATVTVYHMHAGPRNNVGFPTVSGFKTDNERDEAMTRASNVDVAWVRPGREVVSGTARNLARRQALQQA